MLSIAVVVNFLKLIGSLPQDQKCQDFQALVAEIHKLKDRLTVLYGIASRLEKGTLFLSATIQPGLRWNMTLYPDGQFRFDITSDALGEYLTPPLFSCRIDTEGPEQPEIPVKALDSILSQPGEAWETLKRFFRAIGLGMMPPGHPMPDPEGLLHRGLDPFRHDVFLMPILLAHPELAGWVIDAGN